MVGLACSCKYFAWFKHGDILEQLVSFSFSFLFGVSEGKVGFPSRFFFLKKNLAAGIKPSAGPKEICRISGFKLNCKNYFIFHGNQCLKMGLNFLN